jgi:hypothetical protein
VRNTTVFSDRGPTVPENKAFRRSVTSNDTKVNEFLLYGQVDLWPDLVTLYADEDFTTGGQHPRSVRAPPRLPSVGHVPEGRPPLPGLRAPRAGRPGLHPLADGYTFQNPDEGGEIGIQPGPFFLASSVTNGRNSPAGPKDVQATINGYTVFEEGPGRAQRHGRGSFARQSNKRWWAVLRRRESLEVHLPRRVRLHRRPEDGERRPPRSVRGVRRGGLLLFDWLNIRGTFDFVKVAGDRDQTRYAIGAEPFINRVIQPRIQYRINNGIPSDPDAEPGRALDRAPPVPLSAT